MNIKIKEVAQAVELMDKQLRTELLIKDNKIQQKKLWENTYIKHQIDKRNNGECFSVNDHICAMVYSMLSSGIPWERVEKGIDNTTGRITSIDKIFQQYDPEYILKCKPESLNNEIKEIHCASQYTLKQMHALINTNIPKLIKLEEEYGSIDDFYSYIVNDDNSKKTLVLVLSDKHSIYKFEQMGEALVAEYLKNVGYDIAKPDRYIRRILGKNILDCSEYKIAPIYDSFDIITKIAQKMNRPVAEVDYILWSYCAKWYGEICTKNNPKCDKCVAKKISCF